MKKKLALSGVFVAVTTACGIDDTHVKLSRQRDSSAHANTAAVGGSVSNPETTPPRTLTPDQEFLHKISEHHKGMIVLTHEATERSEALPVKDQARSLDHDFDAALQAIDTLLRVNFQDYYEPELSAEYRAKLDTLTALHGQAFVTAFRHQVRNSRQWTVGLVDEYLSKLTRPAVRAFARRMRAEAQQALGSQ